MHEFDRLVIRLVMAPRCLCRAAVRTTHELALVHLFYRDRHAVRLNRYLFVLVLRLFFVMNRNSGNDLPRRSDWRFHYAIQQVNILVESLWYRWSECDLVTSLVKGALPRHMQSWGSWRLVILPRFPARTLSFHCVI